MFFGRREKNDCGDVPPELQNALLFLAALVGDLTGVKVAIDCGADPNIQNKDGITPLHDAASYSRLNIALKYDPLEVVKLLLEHGADPNIQNKDGSTPLHFEAEDGLLDFVKLLLEHGANPNIQDYKYGWTPLHYAAKNCHVDVVRVLLDHGADPTIRDNEGRAPLDYGNDCEEIIEELRRRSGGTTVYK